MSTMVRRLIAVLGLAHSIVCSAQGEPNICGISLDQDAKVALAGFEASPAGPSIFIDPEQPTKKIVADRYFLRLRNSCADLADGKGREDDAPDLIVDFAGQPTKKVISIAFQPSLRDCQVVRRVVTQTLGSPLGANSEVAEWVLPELRRRILVTAHDGQCWIHQQRLHH